jgi:heme oxygenase
MTGNLALQLREGTSKSHSMAENVSFVKSFLGGVIDKSSYGKMLSNLYFIYSAIEKEFDTNKENEFIKPIYFPELNRSESLGEDLRFYYGEDWRTKIQPSEATTLYINRITKVGKERPELLVAHAYTRYLGDLSGGQILKKIAQRAMNLESETGLAFYNFKEIKDEQAFKKEYKGALDSLPVTQKLAEQIVAEANMSFNLNMKMFQELETSFGKIVLGLILNSLEPLKKRFQFSNK